MYGLNDRNKHYNFNNNKLASFFIIQWNGTIHLPRSLQFWII